MKLLKPLAAAGVFSLFVACAEKEPVAEEAAAVEEAVAETVKEEVAPVEETVVEAVKEAVEPKKELTMDTDDQKISYAVGFRSAAQYAQDNVLKLDNELFLKGVQDALAGQESLIDQATLMAAGQALQKRAEAVQAEESKEARAEGEAFLAENKTKEGVVETASGLQYEVIVKGDGGESPTATDKVKVHYHGTLINGTVFDSSVDRGEPISFALNGVIKGWTEGLQLMSIGDKFRFYIPSDLAYGARATGKISAHSALIFDVELLGINEE